MGDEREAEMVHQIPIVPEKRFFLNLRDVAHRTKSLDDSILLAEFRAEYGNGLGAIPSGISKSEKLHRLTSMSKGHRNLPSIPKVSCRQERKKPTWRNSRRNSATSAYSSTNLPAEPGCSSSSHPTSIHYNARSRECNRHRPTHWL